MLIKHKIKCKERNKIGHFKYHIMPPHFWKHNQGLK